MKFQNELFLSLVHINKSQVILDVNSYGYVCDTVTYKKYIFCNTDHRSPKSTWNFPSDKIKVSFVIWNTPFQPHLIYDNEVTFEKLLGNLRMGAGCQRNQD